MSGSKPFSKDSLIGYAKIRAEQERQAREAQEREAQTLAQQAAEKAQRDQDIAKLVDAIAREDVYYDELSDEQKDGLNNWARSLPYPEGKDTFQKFFKGAYGYGRELPTRPHMNQTGIGFSFNALFAGKQKKPGKSAKRKSSTKKSKRTQKRS